VSRPRAGKQYRHCQAAGPHQHAEAESHLVILPFFSLGWFFVYSSAPCRASKAFRADRQSENTFRTGYFNLVSAAGTACGATTAADFGKAPRSSSWSMIWENSSSGRDPTSIRPLMKNVGVPVIP
jgi:hypothetical protein